LDADQPPYAHVPVHADDNKPSLSRRGPKPSIRWASLIEALLHLERDGELVTGKFDGPGELLRRIQDIVPEGRQFDDRSIEPIVAYVHEHLLCGPPPRN
jgi:hypothetical protein